MIKACEVEILEWEEEASYYTPGSYWVYGSEYYAVKCVACVPKAIANSEYWEEKVYEWIGIASELKQRRAQESTYDYHS